MDTHKLKVFPPDNKLDKSTSPRVVAYDFKRPDKFSLEQLRTFSIIHDTFCRLLNTQLSAMLRLDVAAAVNSADQLTFGEFMESIPEVPAMGIIGISELGGSALLEMDPCLCMAVLNRLFGGSGEIETPEKNRALTGLETGIMTELFKRFAGILKESWNVITDSEFRLGSFENYPKFAQIVPPTEMIILASIRCRIGNQEGFINFAVPFVTIEPVLSKFSSSFRHKKRIRSNDRFSAQTISSLDLDSDIFYETGRMTLKEIQQVISGKPLEVDMEKPFVLSLGGTRLLNLYKQENGNYRTEEDPGSEVDLSAILPAQEHTHDKNLLAEDVKNIRNDIRLMIESFDSKFSELQKKQDILRDQFVFEESVDFEKPGGASRPFSFIKKDDIPDLFALCCNENPQAVAVILSYLDATISAGLLDMFPEDKQADLIQRVSFLDRLAPELLEETEKFFYSRLKEISSFEMFKAGGIHSAVEILNLTSRSTEKNVVETFEKNNPELAESIKQNMFVFEDIVILQKKDCRTVLAKVDRKDLLLSLKMADDSLKDYISSCLNENERKSLEQNLKALGRVRITEIEKAQVRIVNTIRVLEENGEIMVARQSEIVE